MIRNENDPPIGKQFYAYYASDALNDWEFLTEIAVNMRYNFSSYPPVHMQLWFAQHYKMPMSGRTYLQFG